MSMYTHSLSNNKSYDYICIYYCVCVNCVYHLYAYSSSNCYTNAYMYACIYVDYLDEEEESDLAERLSQEMLPFFNRDRYTPVPTIEWFTMCNLYLTLCTC